MRKKINKNSTINAERETRMKERRKTKKKKKKHTINRKYGGHTLRLVTGNHWKTEKTTIQ